MSIKFRQYFIPDGHAEARWTSRPSAVEAEAQRFVDGGGRFEAEVLRNGLVSLTAVCEIEGEDQDAATELCGNGPGVPKAVDKLIAKAVEFMESRGGIVSPPNEEKSR